MMMFLASENPSRSSGTHLSFCAFSTRNNLALAGDRAAAEILPRSERKKVFGRGGKRSFCAAKEHLDSAKMFLSTRTEAKEIYFVLTNEGKTTNMYISNEG
jgi:hypothetical protein